MQGCSKNRKIVPYHGSARIQDLPFPSLIMAPDKIHLSVPLPEMSSVVGVHTVAMITYRITKVQTTIMDSFLISCVWH